MRSKLLFLIVLLLAMTALSGTVCAGEALYERWESSGSDDPCELLTDTSTPDYTEDLTSLEWGVGDDDSIDDYKARITAFIVPPVTGNYTFWLCSDDNGYLWLSTNSDPANAVKIAEESSWSPEDTWGEGEEQSAPIALVGGTRYWLRAAHQEGDGGDHIRIAWGSTDAGIADHTVITDEYLGSDSYSHSPDPPSNSKVAPGLVDLKWENETAGTCTVWWDDGSADVNSINFQWHIDTASGEVTNIGTVANEDPNQVLNKTVVEGRIYHWRVDVGSMPGGVWNFSTINDAPEVDAGPKQAKWQDTVPNPVTFQLGPTVSDDGIPIPPGTLMYLWTDTGGVIYDPGPTALAPTATMAAVGDYTLTLTVSDGTTISPALPALASSDTVKLRVHANGTTGLLGLYDMEEGNAAAQVHEDYADRNHGDRMTDGAKDKSGTTMGILNSGHNDTDPCNLTAGNTPDGDKRGIVFDNELIGYVQFEDSANDPNFESPAWADLQDEVTLAAWIKIDSETGWTNNWENIISRSNESYRLHRNNDGDSIQMAVNIDTDGGVTQGPAHTATGTTPVNDGNWHHVMGTYDGAEVCVYVDGLEEECTEVDGQINWPKYEAFNLAFGQNIQIGSNTSFGGTMDEVRIHDIGLPHRSDAPEKDPLHSVKARSVVSIYRTSGGHNNCGGAYLTGDENEDCYVDIDDVKLMGLHWVECNSIANPECD